MSTVHPLPSVMSHTVAGVLPGDTYAAALGIAAERARVATLLLARAQAAHDRAVASRGSPDSPTASEAWGRAMGEAETLTALAAELIP